MGTRGRMDRGSAATREARSGTTVPNSSSDGETVLACASALWLQSCEVCRETRKGGSVSAPLSTASA